MSYIPIAPLIPSTVNTSSVSMQNANIINDANGNVLLTTNKNNSGTTGNLTITTADADADSSAGSITIQAGTGSTNGNVFISVNGTDLYQWPTSTPPSTNYVLTVTGRNTVDGVTTYTLGWTMGFICFHASSMVMLENGSFVRLDQLRYGDRVLCMDKNMNMKFSPVVDFTGVFPNRLGSCIKITHEKGSIIVSGNHLVYVQYPQLHDDDRVETIEKYIMAKDVDMSMSIMSVIEQKTWSKITKIETGTETGWYTPLTGTDTIIVNGILASCHTTGPHGLASFMYKPWHMFLWLFPHKKGTLPKETVSHVYSMKFRRGYCGHLVEKFLGLFRWD